MESPERSLDELEERLKRLYGRLVEGDPVAPAEFAQVVIEEYGGRGTLINALKNSAGIPSLDQTKDELASIVGLFVAQFLEDPFKYDPARGPLGYYIHQALQGDVINESEKLRRHQERRADPPKGDDGSWGARVEEAAHRRNPQMTPEEQVLDEIELTEEERSSAMAFIDSLSPNERACLELMGDGVRESEPYAEALGFSHLSVEAQRKSVNRVKDRLKKKIKRLG